MKSYLLEVRQYGLTQFEAENDEEAEKIANQMLKGDGNSTNFEWEDPNGQVYLDVCYLCDEETEKYIWQN